MTNCVITGNSASVYGGGVYSGALYNCTLTGNSAQDGGGVVGGTLYNCTLSDNSAYQGGGSFGGTLYNCTLTGNSASYGGGAYGGTFYNCTLTGNSAADNGGGVDYTCTLHNCIVYFNSALLGFNYYGGATFDYSCTTPLPSNGANNISVNPQMATLTHLLPDSPCIGAGSSEYATGVDIDGQSWADPPCMGADQVTPGQATGALVMSIEAEYTNTVPGYTLSFGADNQGLILSSVWDFGDGTVVTNQPLASHSWSVPGSYTVRLTGYNDSFPDGVPTTVQVEVTDNVYYVNQANPTPVFPYTSWETAATNIQDAIEARRTVGGLVLVTNGVYASGTALGEGTNRIALTYPVLVQTVNGPEVTVIEGAPGIRGAYVGREAVLSGFTLTNGNASTGGGAWCEDSAILTNCILAGNSATNSGGGAYHGTLYNCTLAGNSAALGGGAVLGTLCHCMIEGNSARTAGGTYAGALYNCILTGNSATNSGGGAYHDTFYNCTLSGNWATISGGGVSYGVLHNCIVYFNLAPSNSNYFSDPGKPTSFHSCCTTPLPTNGEGNITSAPLFVDLAAGDLHLRYGSAGIDAGTDLSAILTTDFDGNPRPLDGDGDGLAAFDMGAYEFNARSMIPSDWFTSHGLDAADPQVVWSNPDLDPFNTFEEWLADTDPTNAMSYFHIETISRHSPVVISFQSSSNRTYTLWSTPQLTPPDWAPVPGEQAIPGNGGSLTLTDPTNAPQRFYRVEANLP